MKSIFKKKIKKYILEVEVKDLKEVAENLKSQQNVIESSVKLLSAEKAQVSVTYVVTEA